MCLLSDHSVHGYNVNIVVFEESQNLCILILREPFMSAFLVDLSECERRDAYSVSSTFGGAENVVRDFLAVDTLDELPFQPSDEDG